MKYPWPDWFTIYIKSRWRAILRYFGWAQFDENDSGGQQSSSNSSNNGNSHIRIHDINSSSRIGLTRPVGSVVRPAAFRGKSRRIFRLSDIETGKFQSPAENDGSDDGDDDDEEFEGPGKAEIQSCSSSDDSSKQKIGLFGLGIVAWSNDEVYSDTF